MNEPHDARRGGMPTWAKVIVAILAIIGGLTVLFAAACFGMIWLNY